jgi:hypothetical protein
VVVNDLDFVGMSTVPSETNPKLLIDANAPLVAPISVQAFESIAGWSGQVAQLCRPVDLVQPSPGDIPLRSWATFPGESRVDAIENVLRTTVPERLNHQIDYNG